jgi:hypothetical protein
MNDLVEILKISGPVALIAIYSVYRMDRNYYAAMQRLARLEDDVFNKLLTCLSDAKQAITDCKIQQIANAKANRQKIDG